MPKLTQYFLLIISLIGYILIGYIIERSNFLQLITVYTLLFSIAYVLQTNKNPLSFNLLLSSGILFRFCLIFSLPTLSDDFYRFVWDGRLQELGFNPFDFTPSQLIDQLKDPLLLKIYPYLNSPNYFSVYPQFCQYIFRLASGLGADRLYETVIILKSTIFLSELGTILLLKSLLQKKINTQSLQLIYVLNPLVIIELTGNIHFEAYMIFFTLLAVWLFNKQNYFSSAAALSMAIHAKLIPLIFIPLITKKIGFNRTVTYLIACLVLVLVLSMSLLNNTDRLFHFFESLRLYYGKFEFNGSFYLFFRFIGQLIFNYNPIAILSKIMIALALAGMLWIYFKTFDLLTGIFWLLTIYLFFSAVVHPWYITPLVALSSFTRFRFAILWSALIPLSYFSYINTPFSENYLLISFEYLMVIGFLIWELKSMDQCERLARWFKIIPRRTLLEHQNS